MFNSLLCFQIVGEMFSGDSFGELALLHGMKRAATIICKGDAEFLTVDKPDFDMVHTTTLNVYTVYINSTYMQP